MSRVNSWSEHFIEINFFHLSIAFSCISCFIFVILPSSFCFSLKTHFPVITILSLGRSTKFQISFLAALLLTIMLSALWAASRYAFDSKMSNFSLLCLYVVPYLDGTLPFRDPLLEKFFQR